MNEKRFSQRSGTRCMALLALCVACWAAAAAPAAAQTLRIGTVLGIPYSELEGFRRANTTIGSGFFGERVPPNDVTILHLSRWAGAPINSAIATVSITRRDNGQKAWRVYFPLDAGGAISPLYRFINANDVFTNPRMLITNVGAVMQLDVRQESPGDFALEGMRFMLLPMHAYAHIQLENPSVRLTVVHTQQMSTGFGAFPVQLVALDAEQAENLKIPESMTSTIQALNTNLQIGPGNLAQVR